MNAAQPARPPVTSAKRWSVSGVRAASPNGTLRGNAPGWIRTSDFLLRRQALYPLSYGRQ